MSRSARNGSWGRYAYKMIFPFYIQPLSHFVDYANSRELSPRTLGFILQSFTTEGWVEDISKFKNSKINFSPYNRKEWKSSHIRILPGLYLNVWYSFAADDSSLKILKWIFAVAPERRGRVAFFVLLASYSVSRCGNCGRTIIITINRNRIHILIYLVVHTHCSAIGKCKSKTVRKKRTSFDTR